ncbi:hypothetical protein Droror1_Dr00023832 [Drosera rotundifolia]
METDCLLGGIEACWAARGKLEFFQPPRRHLLPLLSGRHHHTLQPPSRHNFPVISPSPVTEFPVVARTSSLFPAAYVSRLEPRVASYSSRRTPPLPPLLTSDEDNNPDSELRGWR